MAEKIRVGIVGATITQGGSGWGASAHVPALKALPNYELKAVCTAHEATAEAAKRMFNTELAFHDMKEMAAHPDIDLIAVVVRVPGHAALVEAAENAGKDVFCEWPLAANLAEAQQFLRIGRHRTERGVLNEAGPTAQIELTPLRIGDDVPGANALVLVAPEVGGGAADAR